MFWPLLCILAQAQTTGTLELHVISQAKPAAARVYLIDSAGRGVRIPGAINYSRREELNSTIDGSATVPLPPGRYHIRAEKGMEYRKAERDVQIRSGETSRATLDIARFANLSQRGWYSGDLHNHRSLQDMPLLARAEDLNVSPLITRHVGGPNRTGNEPYPEMDFISPDASHLISLHNQEVERLFAGHGAVDLLNAPKPVKAPKFDLVPLDVEYCREARRDGAFIDAEKPIWKNVPVNVAFGMVDAIGVVNNHFHPDDVWPDAEKYGSLPQDKPIYKTPAGFALWVLDLYYSFLNCGFRIPVSAGSASGVMTSWPGYERVYVHPDGPFTYENWFRALKAGHSFATNGPILLVTADGKLPGAEFNWTKPMEVKLAIEANSQDLIRRVEIIYNGEVVRAVNDRVRLDHPGWLAVRCFEREGKTIRYAHTSPFWFTQNGRLPVKKSDAQHWADYLAELAATVDGDAQQTITHASRIYADLAR